MGVWLWFDPHPAHMLADLPADVLAEVPRDALMSLSTFYAVHGAFGNGPAWWLWLYVLTPLLVVAGGVVGAGAGRQRQRGWRTSRG